MIAVKVNNEIEKRLQHLADVTGRTKSYYVREAILAYLDDMEDTYLALQRLEKPSKKWTLEDVENERDLEG